MTGWQRLRAHIVGLNGKIDKLERSKTIMLADRETQDNRIKQLTSELAGFRSVADEFAPAEAENGEPSGDKAGRRRK